MVNLIASWQSNYYQIAHQMVRYVLTFQYETPLFGCLGPLIIEKTCKQKMHNHCVYVIR